MTNNDITGDTIHTRPNSKEYRDNWDKIFGKKESEGSDDRVDAELEKHRRDEMIYGYQINKGRY